MSHIGGPFKMLRRGMAAAGGGILAVGFLLYIFASAADTPEFRAASDSISTWWAHRTIDETKRIPVYGPNNWVAGEYRNCMLATNYTSLDCSNPNSGLVERDELYTVDVRFLGRNDEQIWTCQNADGALLCKN